MLTEKGLCGELVCPAGHGIRGGVLGRALDNPARMAAHMAAQVSRAMHGRKVDVLISSPNLMRLSIHDMASKEGQLL